MKLWDGVPIHIGLRSGIDEDVILGYPSGRLKTIEPVSLGERVILRSGAIIYQGVTIGNDFQCGHHVVIREQNQIGDHVWIWSNSVIDYGCKIGSRVRIHTNIYLAQLTQLEDDVFIAPGANFANDRYPISHHLEGPIIRRGARIGVNVTILPGVVVGQDALVGAGSVVTRDVPDRKIVAGNPAKIIGSVDDIPAKLEKKSN